MSLTAFDTILEGKKEKYKKWIGKEEMKRLLFTSGAIACLENLKHAHRFIIRYKILASLPDT